MTESLVVAWRKLSGLFKRQRRDKIDLRPQVADEASSSAGFKPVGVLPEGSPVARSVTQA